MKGGRIRRQTQKPIDTVGSWRKERRDNSDAILIIKSAMLSNLSADSL